jgi:putative pyruvate formate lyase activating enzyme
VDTAEYFKACTLCPRDCGADRLSGARGFCGAGAQLRIARAARHDWEEPCISGTRGSGTIFFSGCQLGCVYCQNKVLSADPEAGKEVSTDRLREIFAALTREGVHNINLVTGSHFIPLLAEALTPVPEIPVVFNCGGYERPESLRLLERRVQIYLPDLKYSDDTLAVRYSHAPDYFERAQDAIIEMFRQTGPFELDENGLLRRGVLIRHLILPGAIENSFGVLEWVSRNFAPGEVLLSLMSQYTPLTVADEFPELRRRITQDEYDAVVGKLYELGIEDGYLQDIVSADETYIPDFNGEGV